MPQEPRAPGQTSSGAFDYQHRNYENDSQQLARDGHVHVHANVHVYVSRREVGRAEKLNLQEGSLGSSQVQIFEPTHGLPDRGSFALAGSVSPEERITIQNDPAQPGLRRKQ